MPGDGDDPGGLAAPQRLEPAAVEAAAEVEPAEPGPAVTLAAPAPDTAGSTVPAPDPAAAAVDLLGDLDHDVARAVAHAVADKLALLVAPALLPLVTDELVRTLDQRSADATPAGAPATGSERRAGDDGASAEPPPTGVPTS